MFSQRNPLWSGSHLGVSKWTMGDSGCVTTDVAAALVIAGYTVNPLEVVETFNQDGVYTDNSYLVAKKPTPGLIYFQYIHKAFPQFSLDGNGKYQFVQVKWGTNEHWVLKVDSTIYDPWDGTTHTAMPSQYSPTGRVTRATITDAPVIVQASVNVPINGYQPFETNLEPSQTYSSEVKRMQNYLTDKSFFQDAGPQDGYYGAKTQKAVHNFQIAKGISNSTQYGWWYPKTRAAANKDLSISHPSNI